MLKRLFGDRGFWRTTLRFALPVAIQNLLAASFTLVDTIMVAQLGTGELAAVGMAGQWAMFFNVTLFGICSACSMFVSQYYGACDTDGIHRTEGMALTVSAVQTGLFVLLLGLFAPGAMGIMTSDPVIRDLGAAYMSIAVWSYPAIMLTTVLSAVLRSTGCVKLPMIASFFGTVMNAAANYVLIFGKLGLSALGIRGAALATVVSSWVGFIVLIIASIIQKNIIIAPISKLFRMTGQNLLFFLKKALPIVFNEAAWGGGTLILGLIFSNYDTEGYAARTILGTFENIAFVAFVGLCNSACIMIGKSVGEGNIKRAEDDSRRFAVLVPLAGVITGSIIILFRTQLVSLFNMGAELSPRSIELAGILMLIYGAELPIRNIPYIQVVGIYRSGGDTSTGTKVDLLGLWAMSIPLTAIAAFALHLPFPIVFLIMYVAEDWLKAFLCVRYFRTFRWIRPVTEEGREGLARWQAERPALASKTAENH